MKGGGSRDVVRFLSPYQISQYTMSAEESVRIFQETGESPFEITHPPFNNI